MDSSGMCHSYVNGCLARRYAILACMLALVQGQANTAPLPTPPLTNAPTSIPTSTRFSAPSTYSVPPVPTDPPDRPSGPPDNDDGFDAANYYYAFIAIAIVVLCIVIFLWNIRRRRRKMRSRVRSQSALRQDLESWQDGQRRWLNGMHWNQNPALTRHQHGRRRQREEGLNERGEAPPPYNPDAPNSPVQNDHNWGTGTDAAGNQVTVPLQALSREGTTLKPPDYSETLAPVHLDVESIDVTNHPPAIETLESDAVEVDRGTQSVSHNSVTNNEQDGNSSSRAG